MVTENERMGKELPDELAAFCRDDITLLCKLAEVDAVLEYTNSEFITTLPAVKLVIIIVLGLFPVNALLSFKLEFFLN